MGRDDRIYEEAAALWRELYGEPPPAKVSGRALLARIMNHLPESGYDRLTTPHLRPNVITMPR